MVTLSPKLGTVIKDSSRTFVNSFELCPRARPTQLHAWTMGGNGRCLSVLYMRLNHQNNFTLIITKLVTYQNTHKKLLHTIALRSTDLTKSSVNSGQVYVTLCHHCHYTNSPNKLRQFMTLIYLYQLT